MELPTLLPRGAELTAGLDALTPALAGAAARGLLTAAAVALLLWWARRCGRGAAGLLAGLPTVTGPALLWLAVDHGPVFAATAALGAVAAGVPCALFALGAAAASRRLGPLAALAAGTAAGAFVLPALPQMVGSPLLWVLPVTATVLVCQRALRLLVADVTCAEQPAAASPVAPRGPRAAATTAVVAGIVSAAAALAAPTLGAFWTGVLTSPPLLAAAVAWALHRHGGAADAIRFLHGYTAGLVGRCAFAALFGAFVAERGIAAALALALGASLAIGMVGALRVSRVPATIAARERHRV